MYRCSHLLPLTPLLLWPAARMAGACGEADFARVFVGPFLVAGRSLLLPLLLPLVLLWWAPGAEEEAAWGLGYRGLGSWFLGYRSGGLGHCSPTFTKRTLKSGGNSVDNGPARFRLGSSRSTAKGSGREGIWNGGKLVPTRPVMLAPLACCDPPPLLLLLVVGIIADAPRAAELRVAWSQSEGPPLLLLLLPGW